MIAFGILVYVLAQLLVAHFVSKHIKTVDDYLVAGRNLNLTLATFTIFATWFGVETCVGVAGKVAAAGLYEGNAEPFGYAIALFLVGLFFAGRIWKVKLITIGDVLVKHFGKKTEIVVVLLLTPASIMWAGAQIRTFGAVVGSLTDFSAEIGILFASTVVLIYTVRGGLMADAVTDLIQGIVLIAGLVALVAVFAFQLPDLGAAWEKVPVQKLALATKDSSWMSIIDAWVIPLGGTIVAQELLAKIAASRTHNIAKTSCIISGFGYLTVGLLPVTLALFVASIPVPLDVNNLDQFLPDVARYYLPNWLYVIFAGALISAVLSTVDTALLVASSLVCNNVIIPEFKISEESRKLLITRVGVLLAGVTATIFALSSENVYELVLSASAFGGGGITVVFIAGLYDFKASDLAGMLAVVIGAVFFSIASYIYEIDGAYFLSILVSLGIMWSAGMIFPVSKATT